jgi:hypothetical protein
MLSHGADRRDCEIARGHFDVAQLAPCVFAARDEVWNSRVYPVDN